MDPPKPGPKRTSIPNVIHSQGPAGEIHKDYVLRSDLHNGRPAWDVSMHHSLCWTPYREWPTFGFWALANLWTRDDEGQATGFVLQTPEHPHLDGPGQLPPTATSQHVPPLGPWTRGRPWVGDRTSGGRVEVLSV